MQAHVFELRLFEQGAQSFLRAYLKTSRLVIVDGFGIDGCGCIPELAQEDCAAGVIPNVNRNRSAGACNPTEFLQRAARTRNEIQPQAAYRHIETGIRERQRHRVSSFKGDVRIRAMLASEADLRAGSVDAGNDARRVAFDDSFGDHAAAAAHVNPSQPRGNRQPVQKFPRQQTAPAPHPFVVVLAGSPSINIHRFFFIDSHSTIYCTQRTVAKLERENRMALKKSPKPLKAGKKIEAIKPLSSDRLGVRKLARLARLSRPHSK